MMLTELVRFAWLFALLWPASVLADDGVLPRGSTPAPGRKLLVPEAVMPTNGNDCASYLANADAGELYFAGDGKLVYFLSRQPGEFGPEGKSLLYEVDLDNFRSKRIVSLRTGETASLIGHGQPLEAITVLDFRKVKVGCGEGQSAGIGIKWIGKQRIIKSFPLGTYKIVPTNKGQVLADMEQKAIKVLDLNSYQKRSLVSFADKQIPLYLRLVPLQLISYRHEQQELLRFEGQETEPSAILKLKKGMRLVQQDDQFGIVTGSEDGKTLQVKQIKGWSGDAFRGFDIKLPEDFHSDHVGVATDFRSGLNLVFGATPAIRKELRQVLISNPVKSPRERILKAPEGQYFSQAVLAPNTRKIIILSRSLQDESVQTLRVGDPMSGEWREVQISGDAGADKNTVKNPEKSQEKTGEKLEEKPGGKPVPAVQGD